MLSVTVMMSPVVSPSGMLNLFFAAYQAQLATAQTLPVVQPTPMPIADIEDSEMESENTHQEPKKEATLKKSSRITVPAEQEDEEGEYEEVVEYVTESDDEDEEDEPPRKKVKKLHKTKKRQQR